MGLLTLALVIDLILGDPDWLWRRVPHPVVVIGKVIDWFDDFRSSSAFQTLAQRCRIESKERATLLWGGVLTLGLLAGSLFIGWLIDVFGPLGLVVELLIVAILIAQKSLYDHVRRVHAALKSQGLPAARQAYAPSGFSWGLSG